VMVSQACPLQCSILGLSFLWSSQYAQFIYFLDLTHFQSAWKARSLLAQGGGTQGIFRAERKESLQALHW
jgi:hypothetical protein